MGFDLLTFSQLLDNIFHNIVYYMVTLIINGCSDKLSETTIMGNFMESNKGLQKMLVHIITHRSKS